jgi:hypothetical protein
MPLRTAAAAAINRIKSLCAFKSRKMAPQTITDARATGSESAVTTPANTVTATASLSAANGVDRSGSSDQARSIIDKPKPTGTVSTSEVDALAAGISNLNIKLRTFQTGDELMDTTAYTYRIPGLSEEQNAIIARLSKGDIIRFFERREDQDETNSEGDEQSDDEDDNSDDEGDDEASDADPDTGMQHLNPEAESILANDTRSELQDAGEEAVNTTLPAEASNSDQAAAEEDATAGTATAAAATNDAMDISADAGTELQANQDHSGPATAAEATNQVTVSTNSLYFFDHLITNEATMEVIDVGLIKLDYTITSGEKHTFQIYGHRIQSVRCGCAADNTVCAGAIDLSQLAANERLARYDIDNEPDSETMRRLVSTNGFCPAECDEGWLDSVDEANDLIDIQLHNITLAQHPHKPVCPVCIGRDLFKQQQVLHLRVDIYDVFGTFLGDAIEWNADLNTRRTRVIGYDFAQFDEREYGFGFDDMIDEGDDDYDHSAMPSRGNAGWQNFAEAMDPNSNIKQSPTPEAVIAALPRMNFNEAMKEMPGRHDGEQFNCLVCQDVFKNEDVVIQLPCKHVYRK